MNLTTLGISSKWNLTIFVHFWPVYFTYIMSLWLVVYIRISFHFYGLILFHLSVNGPLDTYFHLLAVMNNALMNIDVQLTFQTRMCCNQCFP